MAFFPIYSAQSDAGEYAQSLFTVVAISLILSWLISMTMTPLNCIAFLKPPEGPSGGGDDPYDTGFFRAYREDIKGFTVLIRLPQCLTQCWESGWGENSEFH